MNQPRVKYRLKDSQASLSLSKRFVYKREKKHALASLGLSPVFPPEPGTLAYVREKVGWIMGEAEKAFGSEFSEVVDIKKVRAALELMLDSKDPEVMEKALKNVPGILVAVARWCKADKQKDAKPPELLLLEIKKEFRHIMIGVLDHLHMMYYLKIIKVCQVNIQII